MTRWQPMSFGPDAPANDSIDFTLTPKERTQASIASLQLERARRDANDRDRKRLEAAQRGNHARLGVDWPDDAA